MKVFILRSLTFFIIALLVTVGLYFLVSSYLTPTTPVSDVREMGASTTKATKEAVKEKVENTAIAIPEKGIPLSSLKLSDEQKSLLGKVGINTQTFVLTNQMVSCASEKLGSDRVAAITGGGSPTLFEVTKLLPCLGS